MKRFKIMNPNQRVIDQTNDLQLAISLIPLDVEKVTKKLYGFLVEGKTRNGAKSHYFIVDFGMGI